MTLKECYDGFGGNYEDVISRLVSDERITKYLGKFVANDDFAPIESAVQASDCKEAFRNVHTLKGLALNLGLTPLYAVSDSLCEYLRNDNADVGSDYVSNMLVSVREAYDKTVGSIKDYLGV